MAFTVSNGDCAFRFRSVCSFGRRKRILVGRATSPASAAAHSSTDDFCAEFDSDFESPMKRRCREHEATFSAGDRSLIEALPQEIFIKIVCGVDHDDLKQLLHVSKTIRESTLIAKEFHFAYTTPTKAGAARNHDDECEAPNAAKQQGSRVRGRLDKKQLAGITVALWPQDELVYTRH